MPRLIAALPLLATVVLAACNQQSSQESAAATGQVSLTNASPAEVAKQAQAAGPLRLTPGEWETSVQVIDMDMAMPGMAPQAHAEMKKSMMASASRTFKSCMTPEQAEKPGAGTLTGKADGRCTYRNFTMANGRIDGTLVCTDPRGGEMKQTIAGTFTPTSFALDSALDTAGMKMKARTSGRRVGECKS